MAKTDFPRSNHQRSFSEPPAQQRQQQDDLSTAPSPTKPFVPDPAEPFASLMQLRVRSHRRSASCPDALSFAPIGQATVASSSVQHMCGGLPQTSSVLRKSSTQCFQTGSFARLGIATGTQLQHQCHAPYKSVLPLRQSFLSRPHSSSAVTRPSSSGLLMLPNSRRGRGSLTPPPAARSHDEELSALRCADPSEMWTSVRTLLRRSPTSIISSIQQSTELRSASATEERCVTEVPQLTVLSRARRASTTGTGTGAGTAPEAPAVAPELMRRRASRPATAPPPCCDRVQQHAPPPCPWYLARAGWARELQRPSIPSGVDEDSSDETDGSSAEDERLQQGWCQSKR